MLKYADLRPTNLIIDRTGEVVPFYMASLTTDDEKIFPASVALGWINVDPVPLSVEWLQKLCFAPNEVSSGNIIWKLTINNDLLGKHTDNEYCLSGSSLAGRAGSVGLTVNGTWASKRCFWVHQIQNLYHSLTGEELPLSDNE